MSKVNTCNCYKSKKKEGLSVGKCKSVLKFIKVETYADDLCVHCGSYTLYQDVDNPEKREYANTQAKEDRYDESDWMNGESKWL